MSNIDKLNNFAYVIHPFRSESNEVYSNPELGLLEILEVEEIVIDKVTYEIYRFYYADLHGNQSSFSFLLRRNQEDNVLIIRPYSQCQTSEFEGYKDCDCNDQRLGMIDLIRHQQDHNIGMFYLHQEGRGHGYDTKKQILQIMQQENVDSYEACRRLGIESDVRSYDQIALALEYLYRDKDGIKILLVTNNPEKRITATNSLYKTSLEFDLLGTIGLDVYSDREILPEERAYLESKVEVGGHEVNLDR